MYDMVVKDNFLDGTHLIQLDELIDNPLFAWFLQKEQIKGTKDGCWFSHMIYATESPRSNLYDPVSEMFWSYLKYVSLLRISINLLPRQNPPSISDYHVDIDDKRITTAIFYLNTNNGYTEFKDGNKIESVRNRLIMFPANTSHRAISQTDTSVRIVLNFNFIEKMRES